MTAAERRQRLSALVRRRRRRLGLTVLDAARLAELNRNTWDSLESGERQTRDSNYAAIERALNWQHGSVDDILDGGEPTPIPEGPTDTPGQDEGQPEVNRYMDPVTGEEYQDPEERALWDLTHFEEQERRELIIYLRTRRAAAGSERQRKAS